MRFLIAEDDFITSKVMNEILSAYGECELAANGAEAIQKFVESFTQNKPFNAIFLDIMMPEKDGQEVLSLIRNFETKNNINGLDAVKIIMTTALDDFGNIRTAFKNQCDGYIVKPIDNNKVVQKLLDIGIL